MTLDERFEQSLEALGLNGWVVAWTPREGGEHGKTILDEKLIVIFDKDPVAAWATFRHEIAEIMLKPVLSPLYTLNNALIKVVEQIAYRAKENFIDKQLPAFLEVFSNPTEVNENAR